MLQYRVANRAGIHTGQSPKGASAWDLDGFMCTDIPFWAKVILRRISRLLDAGRVNTCRYPKGRVEGHNCSFSEKGGDIRDWTEMCSTQFTKKVEKYTKETSFNRKSDVAVGVSGPNWKGSRESDNQSLVHLFEEMIDYKRWPERDPNERDTGACWIHLRLPLTLSPSSLRADIRGFLYLELWET